MNFISNKLYHVYNQGNNKEAIFRNREDYLHFLHIITNKVSPVCNILVYCLMPNHFHFLLDVTEYSNEKIKLGGIVVDRLTNAFRKSLSDYAQDFNKKYKRSGSLFRQKTKGKCVSNTEADEYAFTCFHYIHQNPLKANLVTRLEDWEFSSFRDYIDLRNGGICTKDLAYQFINIDKENFLEQSYQVIDESLLKNIFA